MQHCVEIVGDKFLQIRYSDLNKIVKKAIKKGDSLEFVVFSFPYDKKEYHRVKVSVNNRVFNVFFNSAETMLAWGMRVGARRVETRLEYISGKYSEAYQFYELGGFSWL